MTKRDKRPEWLIKLDAVAMTIAQSKQVKRRNEGLLDELARVEDELLAMKVPKGWGRGMFVTRVGCPHCLASECCEDCSWGKETGTCQDAEFDGVAMCDVLMLGPLYMVYWSNRECLCVMDRDKLTRQDMADCIALIRKFLNAHITWANDNNRRRRAKKGRSKRWAWRGL